MINFKNIFTDFYNNFKDYKENNSTELASGIAAAYDSVIDRNKYGNQFQYSDRIGGTGVGNTLNDVGNAAIKFNPVVGLGIKAASGFADNIGFLRRKPEDITEYYSSRDMPSYNLGGKAQDVASLEPGRAFWSSVKKTGGVLAFQSRNKARQNKRELEQDLAASRQSYSNALMGYNEANQFQNVIDARRMDLMNRFMGIPNL